MSSNDNNRGRSQSRELSTSGLRRVNQHRQQDTPAPVLPRRQPQPSLLDQHQADQRSQASRLGAASSAAQYAAPRVLSALVPSVALARNTSAMTTSARDTLSHVQQGDLRQASASAVSTLSSALSLAHVPVVPQVLSAVSATLTAPETINQHQASVAGVLARARSSRFVPQGMSAAANLAFKKTIKKQD